MIRTLAVALALTAALPVLAQDAPKKMSPEEARIMEAYQKAGTPGEQHATMAKMAGTYDLTLKSWNSPDQPPTTEKGTATRKMLLGGRVMSEEVESRMMGQPFTGHGMTGYDNVSGKWWSTWTDSMSTGLMLSEGECDAAGACTFHGSWNDPVTKGKINSRMTSRWTSPTVEVFEMYAPGPDGKETRMMEITYTRR